MKIFIRGVATTLAVGVLGAAGVDAQVDRTASAPMPQSFATGISCLDAYDASSFAFTQCSGAWNGNNHGAGRRNPRNPSPGEAITRRYMNRLWGVSGAGMDYSGGPLFGEFVLAVKGARAFSLFYFEDHDGSDLDPRLAMAGVAVNRSGRVQGLSHATVYRGRVSVPEPSTLFLIGTGILALSGMAWRRREEALARV